MCVREQGSGAEENLALERPFSTVTSPMSSLTTECAYVVWLYLCPFYRLSRLSLVFLFCSLSLFLFSLGLNEHSSFLSIVFCSVLSLLMCLVSFYSQLCLCLSPVSVSLTGSLSHREESFRTGQLETLQRKKKGTGMQLMFYF